MAIPEGRMSTQVIEGEFLPPDNRNFFSVYNYEKGPIALEDTSEGLLYQDWRLEWESNTGNVVVYPETSGGSLIILNLPAVRYITFTFDQNGRISASYSTDTSSYIWWYDTALAQRVTTDLGADVITPSLHLDDKRSTQNAANDMLLWYTKQELAGTYELFMLRQRDRFLTEYSMSTGLVYPYIGKIGISDELRVQIQLLPSMPTFPYSYPYY